mmetsp:Transcript_13814/g.20227  ORF Transcript_13814/g.20227 Transcript_13814/m.20227 type:complete len:249 (-) Transcript_13814:98-844(-)|eukprot:CAMPEP_0194049472 /NCGR_PEP_ID=MMETSP0009_2-20130614/30696_1 /TAXON_ID=210454 /ORGANISM="Grammatophora oceanica, Strain CCMP 410" /LENGTH=248 /DNA_ID=CAMNT_0038695635 /DNA_START=62 /DNA_END=811 /DNA_ORIENTATION=-
MVQSLNTKALFTLASVLKRPGLMSPHLSVANISQINYKALKDHCGIRAVVFDKDNTLTGPYDLAVHPKAVSGLAEARRVFGPNNVAILSNSAGTKDDPDYKDASAIEESMNIAVIRHDEKKPGGLDELLRHFNGSEDGSSSASSTVSLDDPSEVCMVGDRLLTDIVFGNLYGMLTVHTLPLCSGKENARDNTIASILRSGENMFLYRSWLGSKVKANPIPHKFWDGEIKLALEEEEEAATDSSSSPLL